VNVAQRKKEELIRGAKLIADRRKHEIKTKTLGMKKFKTPPSTIETTNEEVIETPEYQFQNYKPFRGDEVEKAWNHYNKSIGDNNECVICRENCIQPSKAPCNHYFCIKCVYEISKRGNDCPLCKKSWGEQFKPSLDTKVQAIIRDLNDEKFYNRK